MATQGASPRTEYNTAALQQAFRDLLSDPAVCPRRLMDASWLVYRTARQPGGWWLVEGRGELPYSVVGSTCTCPDYRHRGGRCKHRLAVDLVQRLERAETDAEQDTAPEWYGYPPDETLG